MEVSGGKRRLDLELAGAARGGPVFDLAGRLIGVSLPRSGAPDELLPASALLEPLGELWPAAAPATPVAHAGDETSTACAGRCSSSRLQIDRVLSCHGHLSSR